MGDVNISVNTQAWGLSLLIFPAYSGEESQVNEKRSYNIAQLMEHCIVTRCNVFSVIANWHSYSDIHSDE